MAQVELESAEEWSDSDVEDVSDSEVGDALDWLDAMEGPDGAARPSAAFSTAGGVAAARRPNAHGGVLSRPFQPLSNRTQKLASHIRATPLEEWEGRMNVGMSNSVTTAIRGSIRDTAIGKIRNNEKADRATVEQANVYHATKTDGQELAIKVYKTSVLVFKVRAAGIRCPVPLLLRLHVLVMEFIGKGGWAAPRLKDAALSDDKLRESYFEIVTTMRTLYQKCKLVHGDLSEYNILYFEGHLYIIDVSQSVDLDHPSALDFLKEDCLHVSDFFKKRGVAVMSVTDLFNFVIDQNIADEYVDDYLEKVQRKILENGDTHANDEISPTVMVQTLDYVKQCEADIVNMSMMQRPSLGYEPPAEKLYEQPLLGFVRTKNMCADEKQQEQLSQNTVEETLNLQNKCILENRVEDDEDDSGSCSSSDEDDSWHEADPKMGPEERKAARKENKKKVKEEKREARKTKIPKAEKKKRKKMAKAKCKR
ncbi:hypothetical protein PR202_gb11636 [Eleusine coracana subsp. coracana]|uniref:Serine/threonine-protein kinase RIO1 n=1 Tax=Eleusine coracana subsp. coracana TaxID=191504 RepID=A0AAV5EKQ1_ELECO|nr:hypothetical protein PR202_gb11636 [Eleusine coracana subsp. coracana]